MTPADLHASILRLPDEERELVAALVTKLSKALPVTRKRRPHVPTSLKMPEGAEGVRRRLEREGLRR